MTEIIKNNEQVAVDQAKLRANFKRMFWDIDISKIEFDKHYKAVITQVLNYGYPDEIQALFGIYSEDTIKEVLNNPIKGVWFPRCYKAFCKLLDVEPQKKAINILFVEKKTRKKLNNLWHPLKVHKSS